MAEGPVLPRENSVMRRVPFASAVLLPSGFTASARVFGGTSTTAVRPSLSSFEVSPEAICQSALPNDSGDVFAEGATSATSSRVK